MCLFYDHDYILIFVWIIFQRPESESMGLLLSRRHGQFSDVVARKSWSPAGN